MTVPYALKIEIKKVIEGKVASSRIDVRSIQHMAEPQEPRIWRLRRNSEGSYNRMEYDPRAQPQRCEIKSRPAKPLSLEDR